MPGLREALLAAGFRPSSDGRESAASPPARKPEQDSWEGRRKARRAEIWARLDQLAEEAYVIFLAPWPDGRRLIRRGDQYWLVASDESVCVATAQEAGDDMDLHEALGSGGYDPGVVHDDRPDGWAVISYPGSREDDPRERGKWVLENIDREDGRVVLRGTVLGHLAWDYRHERIDAGLVLPTEVGARLWKLREEHDRLWRELSR